MTSTKVRLLSANFVNADSPENLAAGRGWMDGRRDLAIALLHRWAPSVICAQECSSIIRADLAETLTDRWQFVNIGSVSVWYDTVQHTLVSWADHDLPAPPEADGDPTYRRLVLAQLKAKTTGRTWWAASTHFSAAAADWQTRQMQAAVAFLEDSCDMTNLIFAGDFNNVALSDEPGPRQIGRDAGLRHLRAKIGPDCIVNAASNTFNGWLDTVYGNRWLDDIFTGHNWQPYYARVIETNGASDHQFIIASSTQLT